MWSEVRDAIAVGAWRDGSRMAVDVAAAEAVARGLGLRICSAESAASTTEIVRRVCFAWPGLAVAARSASDDFVGTLIDESRRARLAVVVRDAAGMHEQVAAHAHCPTVVVPPRPITPPQAPVLLALGLCGNDEPAIDFAFEEASLWGVPLLAMHVFGGAPKPDLGGVDPYRYDVATATLTADRLLSEALAGWSEKYPDVHVMRQPVHAPNVTKALSHATSGARMAVIGANRHVGTSCHLLGTVTRAVLRQAACPVAVVRLTGR